MDTKELMIELSDKKLHAIDIKNKVEEEEINSKLYQIKRQQIKKAKVYMSDNNEYKKYLTENLEYIKSKLAVNITVETTIEAIKLLQKIDMRVMFNIGYLYTEVFESGVF